MPAKQKSPDTIMSKEITEKREVEIGGLGDVSVQASREEIGTKASHLTLNLSATLLRKLTDKAQMEGVSVHDFACELLAEGLVLRAWEIVEKKNAMRGISPSNSAPQPNNSYRGTKVGYRNNQNTHVKRMPDSGQKNVSRQNYKNIMEDNANFLEYVRSQEKRDRY